MPFRRLLVRVENREVKGPLLEALRRNPIYRFVARCVRPFRKPPDIVVWERGGRRGCAPHRVKQKTLRAYAKRYRLRVLVETGTFRGDMVEAMKGEFDRIYSIELSETLCRTARARFEGAPNVEIIPGDSGIELGQVMRRLGQPAIFWLDGHYSPGRMVKGASRGARDTPILEELHHILGSGSRDHVILIDDARCFGADSAYPTLEALTEIIRSMWSDAEIAVRDDMIRVTPPERRRGWNALRALGRNAPWAIGEGR